MWLHRFQCAADAGVPRGGRREKFLVPELCDSLTPGSLLRISLASIAAAWTCGLENVRGRHNFIVIHLQRLVSAQTIRLVRAEAAFVVRFAVALGKERHRGLVLHPGALGSELGSEVNLPVRERIHGLEGDPFHRGGRLAGWRLELRNRTEHGVAPREFIDASTVAIGFAVTAAYGHGLGRVVARKRPHGRTGGGRLLWEEDVLLVAVRIEGVVLLA